MPVCVLSSVPRRPRGRRSTCCLGFGLMLALSLIVCRPAAGEPEVVLSGEVVDDAGSGVASATIYVSRDGRLLAEVGADERGRFRVPLADDGLVDVHAVKVVPRNLPAAADRPPLATAEVRGVEPRSEGLRLVVAPDPYEGVVRIRVATTEERVSGARVLALPSWIASETIRDWPSDRTSSIGRADLEGLPRLPVQLRVGRREPWCPAQTAAVFPDPMAVDLHRIATERERIILGRVLDARGAPVAGCGVMVAPKPNSSARPWGDLTGSDGTFSVGVPWSWKEATLRLGCDHPTEISAFRQASTIFIATTSDTQPITVVLDGSSRADAAPPEEHRPVSQGRDAAGEVMEAVLRAHYLGPRVRSLVIQQELSSRRELGDTTTDLGDDVGDEVLLDLERKTRGDPQLPPGVDPGVPTVVLSGAWLGYIHETQGWDGYRHFNRRFPKSNGLLTLSPVGFSADGTQAVLHVSWTLWPRVGEGHYHVLAKRDGVWHVVRRVMTWIS